MTTTQFKSIEQENLYNLLTSENDVSILVAAELLYLFTNDEIREVLNRIHQELINCNYVSTNGWWVVGKWDLTYPLYFGFLNININSGSVSERLKSVIQKQIKVYDNNSI